MTSVLPLPSLLIEMLETGRWPRNASEANRQNLVLGAKSELLKAIAPEEDWLYLDAPPFSTVRQHSESNKYWLMPQAAPHGIDFDLALVIGDFGPGSDAPILLDYRADRMNPQVIRLRWSQLGANNEWVLMSPDFPSFVELLGL